MHQRTITITTLLGAIILSSQFAHSEEDAAVVVREKINEQLKVGSNDWPQWAGSYLRNNVTNEPNVPITWDVNKGENIRWSMPLGSETYGNPVVANGKVYVGTNNGAGYVKRYPNDVDLGALICFDEKDGKFLWQHCSEKLPSGRVHDFTTLPAVGKSPASTPKASPMAKTRVLKMNRMRTWTKRTSCGVSI